MATGRLVLEAAEQLSVQLTPEIATPLFAAVATDTGWYRFASAGSGTYRLAAKLIDAGASPPEIYGELYEQETLGRCRLRGVILSRLETELDGRLVHTYVLKEDLRHMLSSATYEVVKIIAEPVPDIGSQNPDLA